MLTKEDVRAARILLNWSQVALAEACGLDWRIIADFEAGRGQLSENDLAALSASLEAAGVTFRGDDGERVTLNKPT